MARVLITLRIMPSSPDIALDPLAEAVKEKIIKFKGEVAKTFQEPVAFGLKSINIIFSVDESTGDTEPLENEISEIEDVSGVQVTDVRRMIG